jgi:hypothetical protein
MSPGLTPSRDPGDEIPSSQGGGESQVIKPRGQPHQRGPGGQTPASDCAERPGRPQAALGGPPLLTTALQALLAP